MNRKKPSERARDDAAEAGAGSTTRRDGSRGDSGARRTCPECGAEALAEDPETGELVCQQCGLVVEAAGFERGPEWRAYTPEEREEKTRVGAPTTPLRHDRGLTTEIDWRDRDAYGKALSPEGRARMERLREWHRRLRARGYERSLRYGLGEIERMSSALDVPRSTREQAALVFRRAQEAGFLPGRSVEAVAASALYAACRREGIPRSLGAISNASRVDRDEIARTYRRLKRELDLGIQPYEPASFVPQIVSELGLSDRVERRAIDIVRETAERDLVSGKSPTGYAAAAVYLAARLCDERVTQKAVASAAGVAELTIRHRYHEQADALGIDY